jgi:type I restriction enzyme S subunit
LDFSDLVYVPKRFVSNRQKLKPGDIIVAASSGSLDVVGKAAPLHHPFEGSFGAFCKVVRPSEQVFPSFLANYFKTPEYRRIISGLAAGANINNLRSEHIDNLEIPLPPLEEQKRIADILDKADAIRRKRQEALLLTDEFLRSVFLEMFGDPVTNPRGLPKIELGNLIKLKSGNSLVGKNMARDGKHPVYGGNGVNGYHDEFMFEERKIVLGRVGVYCGAVHYSQPKSWITDNALYVEQFKRPVEDLYLIEALRYANLNQYAGRAAQPLISGGRIYPVEILFPSHELQLRFAKIQQARDQIHQQLIEGQSAVESLFASLQQRAFSGELFQ